MEASPLRVLLVEDNPGDARLIREMLADARGAPFDVVCAERLSEGLEKLEAGGVDVALLDLSLPDSTGLDTFKKAQSHGGHIPIIVLTSLDDESVAVEAVRGGAQDYLVKGQVDGELLARAMRYAIERKRSEEKLEELYERERKLRQELETEIGRRTEFTRALVHELKTPLTAVLASSELLVAELQDEPWHSLSRNINRSAASLNSRIDELFDLARGETGLLKAKRGKVDAIQFLQSVVDDMSPVALSHRQTLTLDLPAEMVPVWADEGRLRQVVLNLLSNAVKFTPEGGRIAVRASEDDSALVVEVKDNGIGIAKEEQQRLFEPYSRLDREGERLSGMGLGLALCKMLVELHGGQIWVQSQEGEGSTFGFSVPLAVAGESGKDPETGARQ